MELSDTLFKGSVFDENGTDNWVKVSNLLVEIQYEANKIYDLVSELNKIVVGTDTDLRELNDCNTPPDREKIAEALIKIFYNIGIDRPSNFEDIVTFVREDVHETASPRWSSGDVSIAFRRYLEST